MGICISLVTFFSFKNFSIHTSLKEYVRKYLQFSVKKTFSKIVVKEKGIFVWQTCSVYINGKIYSDDFWGPVQRVIRIYRDFRKWSLTERTHTTFSYQSTTHSCVEYPFRQKSRKHASDNSNLHQHSSKELNNAGITEITLSKILSLGAHSSSVEIRKVKENRKFKKNTDLQ